MLRVALVQHQGHQDRNASLQESIKGIREAASHGAKLVLLQELHAGLYFCQTENPDFHDQAEAIQGPTTQQLGELAKELGIVIVGSIFERRAAGLYHNTAIVLENDGSLAGIYRKMHIPDDPCYYEKYYFTPGDLGFTPIQTSVGKLGVLVCWDQWYPEAARLMALAGADILLYPTAIGWHPADPQDEKNRQLEAWVTIQRAHAVANGCYLLSCNRVGFENDPIKPADGLHFWGNSFIAGPQGEFLAQAPTDKPAVLIADLELKHSEKVRRMWPFLRDRRIDAYEDLVKRYRD